MPASDSKKTEARWIEELNELFDGVEYFAETKGRRIRVRIQIREDGSLEVLADSPHTGSLDEVIDRLLPGVAVEKVLCG